MVCSLRHLSILFSLFSASLLGQTCPSINFSSTPQLAPAGSADLVITRQADGSFTGYGLGGAKPSYTTPDIQNSITNCYPAPAHNGPKPTINFHPTGAASEAGAIVDLNGNGTPELLVSETNPGVTIYWDFNLANPTTLLPQILSPGGLSVADVNGDGKPDLVVLDGGDGTSVNMGGIYVLVNNGDGTFQQKGHYLLASPDSVAIADVNGDGKPDLVAGLYGNPSGTIAVLLGNGDGTFQSASSTPTSAGVISVMVGDFNRDGNPDVAAVLIGNGSSNSIAIFLGNGKGGFTAGSPFSAGGDAVNLVTGDFNGDGIPDLATGNFDLQTVSVLLGHGDGTFQAPATYVVPYGPTELTVTDFNNDGYADILVGIGGPTAIGESENSEVIGVLLGNGDGTFLGARTYPISTSTNDQARFIASADFTGDGKLDAVLGDHAGNLGLFAGNGDGTFQPVKLSTGAPNGPGVTGDFNGDGKPDLAIVQDGGVNILVNRAGEFSRALRLRPIPM